MDNPRKRQKIEETQDEELSSNATQDQKNKEPMKISMDEKGRLIDEKGRFIDVDYKSKFSFDVNAQKYAQKQKKIEKRYAQLPKNKHSVKPRGFFFDQNLPKQKKDDKRLRAFMFGDNEAPLLLRANLIPEVEWWDQPLLESPHYIKNIESIRPQIAEELKNLSKFDANQKIQELFINSSIEKIPYVASSITDKIINPDLPAPDPVNATSHNITMHLTEKERKKLKRLKKAERLNQIREEIKLGIREAPPDNIKLSTVMKLMSKELSQDPTKTEQDIMEKYNLKLQRHLERNEERKLSKEEKLERTLRKLRRDSARERRTALFRIPKVTSNKTKFKISKNARQLELVGFCLVLPEGLPSLIIVEGGKRAIKFYKRLCLHRIDWTIEKGSCDLVWEAEIKDPSFFKFKQLELKNESEARRILGAKGLANYWDLVKTWKRPED